MRVLLIPSELALPSSRIPLDLRHRRLADEDDVDYDDDDDDGSGGGGDDDDDDADAGDGGSGIRSQAHSASCAAPGSRERRELCPCFSIFSARTTPPTQTATLCGGCHRI